MTVPVVDLDREYEDWLRKQQLRERRADIAPVEDFSLGVSTGLAKTGTSAVRGLSWLARLAQGVNPGVAEMGRAGTEFADRTEAEVEDYYDPQGLAGTAGEVAGRLTGEAVTSLGGGRAAARAIAELAPASRAARAILAGQRGTVGQRVAANVLPFAPVDVAMGAGGSEEGFVLPGRGGAAVESLAMGALPSAAIEAAMARRELTRTARRTADARTLPSIADVLRETRPAGDPLGAMARSAEESGARAARVEALEAEPGTETSQLLRAARDARLEAQARSARSAEIPAPPAPTGDARPMREILDEFRGRSAGVRAVETERATAEEAARQRRLPVPVDESRVTVPMTQYADEADPATPWMAQLADRASGLQETAIERAAISEADVPAPVARGASGRLPASLTRVDTQALVDELARAYDNVGSEIGTAPVALENDYGDVWSGVKDFRAGGRNASRMAGAQRIEAELTRRGVDVNDALARKASGETADGATGFPFGANAPEGIERRIGGSGAGRPPLAMASRPGTIARELLESAGGAAFGATAGGAATGDVRGAVAGGLAGAGAPAAARGIGRIARDVREAPKLRRAVEELTEQRNVAQRTAETDALTELPNARAYRAALATAEADPATAVIRFDANGFKGVNDALGHGAGDETLRAIAQALRNGAGDGARAFRVGGDEFALLAPADGADALRARVEEAFGVREVAPGVRVSLSGGVGATDVAADQAAAAAKSAAKEAQGIRARAGAVAPAVINTMGGAAAGATAGALTGDTPEERRRHAVIGTLAGAGLGATASPLLRAAMRGPKASALFTTDPDVAAIATTIRRGEREVGTRSTPFLRWHQKAYQSLVNESYAAEQFGRVAGTGDTVHQAVAQGHGWQGAADQFLRDEYAPVLAAAKGMEEDVMALVKAQRAIEQTARGVADKTQIPLATHLRARAVLEQQPQVKAAAEQLRAFYRRLLELKRDGGVLSADQYDQIVASEDFYTPFVREWDDKAQRIGGGGGGKNVQRGTGVRKLDLEAQARADTVDPFEIAVADAGEAFRAIAKQRVTDAVVGAYHADPASVSSWLRPMAATDPVSPGARVVEANVAGRRTRWEVTDPDLYDAFGAFDPATTNLFVKVLGYGKRALQLGVTFMPDFAIANAVRDTAGAAIQQRALGRSIATGAAAGAAGNVAFGDEEESIAVRALQGAGFGAGAGALGPQAVKNLRAVGDILGQSPAFKQFLREGGYTMGFYPRNASDARQVLERLRSSGVSLDDVVSPSRWVDLVMSIGRVSEQATRLAKWKEVAAAGGTLGERVLGAQDVSLRFAQQGRDTKGIAATTAFWNAKIQGWDKLARMLRQPKTWAVGAAAITAPSLALWGVNKDDPEYWARPQWERNMFWLLPKGGETGGFWRVPKPFEIGFLFASLPERFADYLANTGVIDSASPFVGAERPGDLLRSGAGAMAGTSLDGTLPIPTAPKAIAEQLFNEDLFYDRRIVSRPDLPVEQQVDERTSGLALLAGKLGVSPQRFDKLVRDLTGATGVTVLQGIDALSRELGIDERTPAPGTKRPLIGRFETQPGTMSDAESVLRRRFELAERAYRGFTNLERQEKSPEELRAYVAAHKADLKEYVALKEAIDLADQIRDARREMARQSTLTPAQREQVARRSGALLNELSARALRGQPATPVPEQP